MSSSMSLNGRGCKKVQIEGQRSEMKERKKRIICSTKDEKREFKKYLIIESRYFLLRFHNLFKDFYGIKK